MKPQFLFSFLVPISTACLQHLQSRSQTAQPPSLPPYNSSPLTNTAIQNVRVFNGTAMTPPQTIIISGTHISTPTNTTSINTTIDATGLFLIPGLIDSHLHLQNPSDLLTLTSYGITTALQMNCQNYTHCTTFRTHPGLTSFHTAGLSAVGPNSSHAKMLHRPANQLFYPNSSAEQFVHDAFAHGADYYKITAELNGPSREAQRELVSAVHARGRLAMTHAADVRAYEDASASGTDGLQHVPKDGVLCREVVRRVRDSGTQFVTPTLSIFNAAFGNPDILGFLGGMGKNASLENVMKNVGMLRGEGVPILAGTDAVGDLRPVANVSIEFGKTLHEELGLLVQAGLSEAEALDAATRIAARWHRLDDRGVVEPGKRADLVLLGSNPLENIGNTFDLERVWIGGREYQDVKRKR
ncbi:hypothetical protein EJ04DRAFT_155709 [Polyplosphaeria fusca]|uniref:Amidohydrolase-related domain-containing protein n=1 Tax=Polyplosphaeria fusca TaxID=682080 RepID=A0A9P4USP5_9PLEO|nr:hypothetical protein EJ04DRAFT_155709 [Polyplosphaeria fusca]